MAEMSTGDCYENFLEYCHNKQVNLLIALKGGVM